MALIEIVGLPIKNGDFPFRELLNNHMVAFLMGKSTINFLLSVYSIFYVILMNGKIMENEWKMLDNEWENPPLMEGLMGKSQMRMIN